VAQLVVVDQVLIAQGNPKHPLTHQARHGVLN
jgi:site-specific DNA recombinase